MHVSTSFIRVLVFVLSSLAGLNATTAFAEDTLPKALKVVVGPAAVLTGNKIGDVVLQLEVAQGFHVQANPSDPPLIPTNVTTAKNKDVEIFSPKYPAGKKAMVKGLGREISTYEGAFSVRLPSRAKKQTVPGSYAIEGEVRYQACDEQLCYPPQKLPFSVPVSVKSGAQK